LIREYYKLTKPGIIYGNAMTTTAGFMLASFAGSIYNVRPFIGVLVGTVLVIASGCVFNNYIDRGIDKKMARTKGRALVLGKISGRNALIYAALLGIAGFGALALLTNWLTVAVGAIGFIDYVVLYGYFKRKSVYGTLVGSISGATPPLAGYCAVTNQLDAGGLIFFLILVCWQMPHFYAIAMYRAADYANAGIPVLPVKWGMRSAKIHIVLYIAAFVIATGLLTVYGYTGYIYLIIMSVIGIIWLAKGIKGFSTHDDTAWGKKMFLFSLVVNLSFCFLIPIGALLP
jgi:protoheme IX farnesyltransferase